MPKWLVMVYLAGNNNLSEECVFALTEMKRIGSTDDVAVIANLDTSVHRNTPLEIKKETISGKLPAQLKAARVVATERQHKDTSARQSAGRGGLRGEGHGSRITSLRRMTRFCTKLC